jgi:hypothetical protein
MNILSPKKYLKKSISTKKVAVIRKITGQFSHLSSKFLDPYSCFPVNQIPRDRSALNIKTPEQKPGIWSHPGTTKRSHKYPTALTDYTVIKVISHLLYPPPFSALGLYFIYSNKIASCLIVFSMQKPKNHPNPFLQGIKVNLKPYGTGIKVSILLCCLSHHYYN